MDQAQHVPVLAGRVTALLAPALAADGAVLVDATLGRAGHARALLEACPGLLLVGIDADVAAIEAAAELLAPFANRVTLVHARYDEIPAILSAGSVTAGPDQVMGLLFDLGVSSPQLDDPGRGFSYAQDAPLDMRMDLTKDLTAADIVNGYPAAELARVFRDYGEERFARRIADAMVRERAKAPITSTQRLSGIVKDAIPAATRRTGGNPAKRTFQALRIEVNDELGTLRRALPAALGVLAVGGRVVVLAYHSLEDRIVKRELVRLSADQAPPRLPVPASAATNQFRLLTRGAERPDSEEVSSNPRAASARLRAAERIREAA
ncbi:MAG TPA: 16S rRNA (cytosine(1402)-N(4))-methyltransferase RsmH [Streptosporangiaceae bacterium]|nr:16S rRNA (cytosine(1402)-N(4))-methyltransferase RsmH [Streptosporangiaceae bacterium]